MREFFLKIQNENSKEYLKPAKVICIAQNYPKHAEEMKSSIPRYPYFFIKPDTALLHSGEDIILPALSQEVHHEVELAVIIGRNGKHISEDEALSYVLGYAVFLDLTARDIQRDGKKTSRPFGLAKSFDTFAPISEVMPAEKVSNPMNLLLHLEVNGEIRQHAYSSEMLFPIPTLISFLSEVMTLKRGDIIATGTPEGVSEIREGDMVFAEITGVGRLHHKVVREAREDGWYLKMKNRYP